ncbi:hypothetical protein PVAG01_09625 [Phlyctema vagabunda]|uniref:Uncharacterized protein n=1 Tax=Phlyctema vagabunda TaxID=108571 RepID=A0ABR4P7W3_9HELO
MERDSRRARGQWRGCHAFEDIICDGEKETTPRRNGGLKMGCTYYYYYELDDGTEFHDASLPSTTHCPFLPGQPVNLLPVPVEVKSPRLRSGSMTSMFTSHYKTMNPADKFVAPRPPPQIPASVVRRSSTSPADSSLAAKRSARSVSPKSEKQPSSPWSPKLLFSRRPSSSAESTYRRGRTPSSSMSADGDSNISHPVLTSRTDLHRVSQQLPRNGSVSSINSITQNALHIESGRSSRHNSDVIIPEDIAEEDSEEEDDDENFATQLSQLSMESDVGITRLCPPPPRSPLLPFSSGHTSFQKLLPEIPEAPVKPGALGIKIDQPQLERSHFSTSTISTTATSPSESSFDFSEGQMSDSNDDFEYMDEEPAYPTFLEEYEANTTRGHTSRFNGYSLPDGDFASEQTLRKVSPQDHRISFDGAAMAGTARPEAAEQETLNTLQQLMSEMGYLGDHIAGK